MSDSHFYPPESWRPKARALWEACRHFTFNFLHLSRTLVLLGLNWGGDGGSCCLSWLPLAHAYADKSRRAALDSMTGLQPQHCEIEHNTSANLTGFVYQQWMHKHQCMCTGRILKASVMVRVRMYAQTCTFPFRINCSLKLELMSSPFHLSLHSWKTARHLSH